VLLALPEADEALFKATAFKLRFEVRRKQVVNALQFALERKGERSRAAAHRSETPVRVRRAQPDPARAVPWGGGA
jgi:hypothetical protein